MKNFIFRFAKFIDNTFRFIYFLIQLIVSGGFKSQLKNEYSGTVAVLANGPSLKNELPRLENAEEFRNVDFIVLNYFAFDEIFFKIKPQHYCFADSMFFRENHRIEDVQKLYKILNTKVNWNLNIYISSNRYKQFMEFSRLSNKFINIVKINTTAYTGFDSLRNFFYKKGFAIPELYTVAILAIYVGLMAGYSELRLYGVDHTFFDGLTVDENNMVCTIEKHFYNSYNETKPIIRNDNGRPYRMADYLEEKTNTFKSHEKLNSLSQSLNKKIINYTKNSLIDNYFRAK